MKYIILSILISTSILTYSQRSTGIEYEIEISEIPLSIIDYLDIEYSSKENYYILWVHENDYKPLLSEYFECLGNIKSVYNRKTKTDHMNLFIETNDDIFDLITDDSVKYKNIRFSMLDTIDIAIIKTKKDLNTKRDKEDKLLTKNK